jgi:hypothetical protein
MVAKINFDLHTQYKGDVVTASAFAQKLSDDLGNKRINDILKSQQKRFNSLHAFKESRSMIEDYIRALAGVGIVSLSFSSGGSALMPQYVLEVSGFRQCSLVFCDGVFDVRSNEEGQFHEKLSSKEFLELPNPQAWRIDEFEQFLQFIINFCFKTE